MRFLLDTDIAIYWLTDDERLPRLAREIIEDDNNEILFSIASVWEIATRVAGDKLKVNILELESALLSDGINVLPVTTAHCAHVSEIPKDLTDGFDRMLIAQAQEESILFLTTDVALTRFGKSVVTV